MTTIIVIPMPIDMLANRLVSKLNWPAVTMSPRLMACRVYKKKQRINAVYLIIKLHFLLVTK